MAKGSAAGSEKGGGDALGLIAGSGELPLLIAREARASGRRVVLVALDSLSMDELHDHADVSSSFNVGKVGAILKYLKKNSVREVVLAGKVPKTLLYAAKGGLRPDMRALGMLVKLRDRKDDSILAAVEREFRKEGIEVRDIASISPDLLTPEGKLTRRGPDRKQRKDIEFGLVMAKEIGRLDIGQTVVVKDRAVMAVEAIEGTDAAIRRGGALAGGGAVVVKVSRPGQDMRFDVPVVGMDTLSAMREAGAAVLALEAGRSILVNRDEFLKHANEAGISVVGVKAPVRWAAPEAIRLP